MRAVEEESKKVEVLPTELPSDNEFEVCLNQQFVLYAVFYLDY